MCIRKVGEQHIVARQRKYVSDDNVHVGRLGSAISMIIAWEAIDLCQITISPNEYEPSQKLGQGYCSLAKNHVLSAAGYEEITRSKLTYSNGRDKQTATVKAQPLPQDCFHTTLISNWTPTHDLPNIQASNSRFYPIGCAHHLVHHRHSA